jgi:hypothetical protein
MISSQVLDYYRQHSILTDPGTQASLYEDLPHDVPGLAKVVQGVIIYPGRLSLYHIQPQEIDNTIFGLRKIEDLLKRIQRRDPAPLSVERPPKDRIGAICRNFGTLLVSMLRQQGVPARLRIGFGDYFGGHLSFDHRVTEYWDNTQQRWMLADPMMDDVQRKALKITFNTLDIDPHGPFLMAGEVWRRCREGELNPNKFGDSPTDIGMPPIRYALLHDFAALNKCEVLGCDDWGELITKPEASLTNDDLALLDKIADLTMNVDNQFEALRKLFEDTSYGQTVRAHIEVLA